MSDCTVKHLADTTSNVIYCYMCGEKLVSATCECGNGLSGYDRYCEKCGKNTGLYPKKVELQKQKQ